MTLEEAAGIVRPLNLQSEVEIRLNSARAALDEADSIPLGQIGKHLDKITREIDAAIRATELLRTL